jgi:uncharacterized protein YcnI
MTVVADEEFYDSTVVRVVDIKDIHVQSEQQFSKIQFHYK